MYDDTSKEAQAFRDLHKPPSWSFWVTFYLILVGAGAHMVGAILAVYLLFR